MDLLTAIQLVSLASAAGFGAVALYIYLSMKREKHTSRLETPMNPFRIVKIKTEKGEVAEAVEVPTEVTPLPFPIFIPRELTTIRNTPKQSQKSRELKRKQKQASHLRRLIKREGE